MKKALLSLLLPALITAPAYAQQTINEKAVASIVRSAADSIEKNYVFPDKGKSIAEALRKNLSNGKYKQVKEPYELTQMLTTDMRSVVNDKHMGIVFAPNAFKSIIENRTEQRDRFAARNNFAFERTEILQGNIGYIKFNGFAAGDDAFNVAAAAMGFVANSDALIIDLRENGGGESEMIAFLCSYFFDRPMHINSFYDRLTNDTTESWAKSDVPGKRMSQTPLFILTSDYTFSAAEEMAYDLQTLQRATIIGETTGGGAHPVSSFPLQEGFIIRVPTGRAINPITKTNWEGTGVTPDIRTTKEEAFDRAYIEALQAASQKAASPAIKEELTVLATVKKAALNGFATPIDTYAGAYGIRMINNENGQLMFRREQGPKIPLLRLSDNEFIMDDLRTRVKFGTEEGKLTLEIIKYSGEVIKTVRTGG